MSSALVTRGFEAPRAAVAGAGASGIAIPFQMKNSSTGDFDDGVDLSSAGELQVSVYGDDFADGLGDVTNITAGDGSYYYELDNTEVQPNWVWLKIRKTGYDKVDIIWPIDDKVTNDDLDAQTTTLANAITAARDSVNGNVDTRATQTSVDELVDTLPEVIDTFLSGVHGNGSWEGSTPDEIDDLLSSVHGAGNWEGAGSGATIAAAVWAAVGESPHTYGDLVRGIVGALVGPATDFESSPIVIKNINGTKTRWTIAVDDSGRLTCTAGDLT